MSDDDKNKFKKVLKKYYFKEFGMMLVKMYDNLFKDSYLKEINFVEVCGRFFFVLIKK